MYDKKQLMEAAEQALLDLIDSEDLVSPGIEKVIKSKPGVPEQSKSLMQVLKLMGMGAEAAPEEKKEEEMEEEVEPFPLAEEEEDEMDPAAKRKKAIMLAVMKK